MINAHQCRARWRTAALLILLILIAQIPAAAARQQPAQAKPDQQDQPIRLKTELVEIRAVVTDKQGKPITNLSKGDFEVLENGRGQVVSFFSAENVSRERKATNLPGTSPAVRPQVAPEAPPRRTVVLFVDTLHMATLSLLRAKQEMLKFIDERLGDEDMAAVVSTSGGLGLFSQFTQDKRVLRAAISRLAFAPGLRASNLFTPYLAARVENGDNSALTVAKNIIRQEESLYDPHMESIVENMAKSRAREILAESTYQRRVTLLALKAVADRLAELPGQRLILFVSDGFTLLDNVGVQDSDDLRAAISRASRAGVVIYSAMAKGLQGASFFDIGNRLPSDPQTLTLMREFASAGDRELEGGMERLAKGTGGEAFLTTNDLRGAFGKALDDNGFYYALSYYPANPDDKNKNAFRTIKVRVKDHPEYTVRTQSGYLASELLKEKSATPADPRKALIKLMGEPLATSGIRVDASADFLYLPTDNAQVSVNIFIDASKLGYKEQENGYLADLTMLTGVLDSSGRTTDVLQDTIQIRLKREQLAQAREGVYRYTKRLTLKPGLYQIRVGVRDPQTEQMGTAAAWVEVPALKSKKLILSSIATAKFQLDSNKAGQGAGRAVSQPNVRNGINLFRRGDFITYYGKAHKAALGSQNAAGVMIQGQVLQDERVVLQDSWRPLSSFILSKERDAVEFGGRLRAAGFPPGFYTLRILIKDPQSKEALTRETPFEVIP